MILTFPSGSDLRIMLWFSHFSMDGMGHFKFGAYALAHYALAHREEVSEHCRGLCSEAEHLGCRA